MNSIETLGRDAGLVEIFERRLVGRRFLDPAIAEKGLLPEPLSAKNECLRRVGPAGDRGRGAQHQPQQGDDGGALQGVTGSGQMPARDMPGFMGEHAHHLTRVFRLHDEARGDENILPARDEGVEPRIVDDVEADTFRIQAGGGQDRRQIALERVFDLRIPDEADAFLGVRRSRQRCEQGADDRGRQQEDGAGLTDVAHNLVSAGWMGRVLLGLTGLAQGIRQAGPQVAAGRD